MKANALMEHFRRLGTWVDWDTTADRLLHGDPEVEAVGIAVAWIPTNAVLKQAAFEGFNVFITHEPAFYPGFEGSASTESLIREKRSLLDQTGMTLIRCHDTWDRMPGVGIVDAWSSFLGFDCEPRPVQSYYRTCLTGGLTAEEVGAQVLKRVRVLGQESVLCLGDRTRRIHRMVVGTGAITHLPSMLELGADLLLATDDGVNHWTGGMFAVDLQLPLLIVNHATSELPGMQAMAGHLRTAFPGVLVKYFPVEFPPRPL
jgi:putative NIF3 family GTP cyclohydrolase 1 type 2